MTSTARRYMMATTATHKLGDISRDAPDLMEVDEETDTEYVGRWVTGFGFFNVHFPKSSTRELTAAELDKNQRIDKYQRIHVTLAGTDIGPAIPEDK